MTIFDEIKSKNIDELVEWLDKYAAFDGSKWMSWFDNNYCKKCEPEVARVERYHGEHEFGWCELHGKCKFFEDLEEVPDNKQIIKLWLQLESEAE